MLNDRRDVEPHQWFDEAYDNEQRPLEFVFFLDGNENEQTFSEKGLVDFRRSWQRPKWDVMMD